METYQLKKTIHDLIDRIDDGELLNAYLKIIQQGVNSQDVIIGYTTKGEPITPETLKQEIRAASERVKGGSFISQEDLENDSENW